MSEARRGAIKPPPPKAAPVGSPPRTGSASSLIKSARPVLTPGAVEAELAAPPEEAIAAEGNATARSGGAEDLARVHGAGDRGNEPKEVGAQPDGDRPETPRRRATTTEKRAQAGRVPITVELPAELRDRARAMFRHTKHLEGPEFFHELIGELLSAECGRREAIYNGGEPFPGGDKNLPRGRPFA